MGDGFLDRGINGRYRHYGLGADPTTGAAKTADSRFQHNDTGLFGSNGALFPGKGVGLAGLSDGTSNTMLVGEQSGWQYYASTGVGLPGKQGDFRSTALFGEFTGTNANGTPAEGLRWWPAPRHSGSLHDHHGPLAGERLCGALAAGSNVHRKLPADSFPRHRQDGTNLVTTYSRWRLPDGRATAGTAS